MNFPRTAYVVDIEDHVTFSPKGWGLVVERLIAGSFILTMTISPKGLRVEVLASPNRPSYVVVRDQILKAWEEAKQAALDLDLLDLERARLTDSSTNITVSPKKEEV